MLVIPPAFCITLVVAGHVSPHDALLSPVSLSSGALDASFSHTLVSHVNSSAWSTPDATIQDRAAAQMYIDVENVPQDIQAAFDFARKNGVRLVVKNSGHDYKGPTSSLPSLEVRTHNLVDKSFSPAFVAAGCDTSSAREAVTLGAGVTTLDALQYVDTLQKTIVAGSCGSVGIAGGFVAGGGHSALSNGLGLAVDNALQFKVVTPDGSFRTVSRCLAPKLFFALAGGGGGTFGVVVETTFAVHPKKEIQVAHIAFVAPSTALVQHFLSVIVDNALPLVQQGFGGYANLNPVIGSVNSLVFLNPTKNINETRASMRRITDFATSLGPLVTVNQISSVDSFLDAFQGFIDPPGPSSQLNLDTPSALAATQSAMQSVLQAVHPVDSSRPAGAAPLQLHFTSPFNTPATGGTAETPAWRTTVFHSVQHAATYSNSTAAQHAAAIAQVSKATDFLRTVTPDSGTYKNEADVHELDFANAFWGPSNYAKLLEIKARYDPDNLLTCSQCVGSDLGRAYQ